MEGHWTGRRARLRSARLRAEDGLRVDGSDTASEANGRVIEHRKVFAKTYSTNIGKRRGTFVEPKAIRGQFVEWWASRRTDCNEIPETLAGLRGRYF